MAKLWFGNGAAVLDSVARKLGYERTSAVSWGEEFSADVLERLRAIGPTWVPVAGVQFSPDGSIAVRLDGVDRLGSYRRFTLRMSLAMAQDRRLLESPQTAAELIWQTVQSQDMTYPDQPKG